ncbi:hypothetical protein BREVNS_1902 [Brevinematales bacterium NS]|jgi:tetratricopeptide (TPR) repeat protein|nr:tetratricopeptide repeat protein [Brevinematales bacterium]QJR22652.1 hypothetical protein BREVNS_1902 [Brevinematales bacterium NS]
MQQKLWISLIFSLNIIMLFSCQKHFDRGMVYFFQMKYTNAIEEFSLAFAQNDRPIEAAIMQMESLRNLQEYEVGLRVCDLALKSFSNSLALRIEKLLLAADIFTSGQTKDDTLVVECYIESKKYSPTNSWDYRALGSFFHSVMHDQPRAVWCYSKAIEIDPKFYVAYFGRGYIYFNLGYYEKALEDYSLAISLNPKNAVAYNNRAVIYEKLREYRKALKDYSSAIALCQNNPYFYDNRGHIYYYLGKYTKAIQDYTKAIELHPTFTDAYLHRGDVYFALRQYDKAKLDLEKAIELDPNGETRKLAEQILFFLPRE